VPTGLVDRNPQALQRKPRRAGGSDGRDLDEIGEGFQVRH
jgi:hypothetical protein